MRRSGGFRDRQPRAEFRSGVNPEKRKAPNTFQWTALLSFSRKVSAFALLSAALALLRRFRLGNGQANTTRQRLLDFRFILLGRRQVVNERTAGTLREDQLVRVFIEINVDKIAKPNLPGGYQV